MLSNRIILIFLGVIFLIIIILSSSKLSQGIKNKFSGVFPNVKPVPTVALEANITSLPTISPTPTTAHFTTGQIAQKEKAPSQSPGTGPELASLLALSFIGGSGLIAKRLSSHIK